jgi:hypothetical protein
MRWGDPRNYFILLYEQVDMFSIWIVAKVCGTSNVLFNKVLSLLYFPVFLTVQFHDEYQIHTGLLYVCDTLKLNLMMNLASSLWNS